MPSFGAARVEKKIVKIPKNKIGVPLGRAEPVAGSFSFEKDLASDQQRKKLDPRKSVLLAQPFDLLRCGEYGQGSRNLRIAEFEQRAGTGRFHDDLVATASHVSEPREDQSICLRKW